MDAAAIAEHVDEALRSPLFVKAERQARFLRFVVDAALQSPAPLVREFDIARAVYDRRDDYDPRVNPIVRVEAARLRARLREYYEASPPARLRIELPKGRYLPEFTRVAALPRAATTSVITILVQPFKPLGADAADTEFGDGLAEELVHRLTRLPGLRVMVASGGEGDAPAAVRPDVRLEASVRRSGAEVRVTLRLVDPADGVTVVSNLYAATVTEMFAAQEQLAQRMCEDVAAALLPPAEEGSRRDAR